MEIFYKISHFFIFFILFLNSYYILAQDKVSLKVTTSESDTSKLDASYDDTYLIFPEDSKGFKFIQNDDDSSYYLKRWHIVDKDMLEPPEVVKPSDVDIENLKEEQLFKMQEYDTNYIVFGKPDTKVQFSFKFKVIKYANVYLGYTQTMFWRLFKSESSPFSEINFNPEIFYKYEDKNSFFKEIDFGYGHLSNGKDEEASRSIDSVYLNFVTYYVFRFGIPRFHLKLRYLFNEDKTNEDINEFYGPVVLRFSFDKLGQKVFRSEELYFEYYNGGKLAEDFSRSSLRASLRFKIWKSVTAPKIFIQYFNGYGENLANYNIREETYRIGFSIGGF